VTQDPCNFLAEPSLLEALLILPEGAGRRVFQIYQRGEAADVPFSGIQIGAASHEFSTAIGENRSLVPSNELNVCACWDF